MRRVLILIASILLAAYTTLSLNGFLQLARARRLVKAIEELQVGTPIPQELRESEFRNLRCIPDWGCYTGLSNLPFVDFFASPRRLPPRVTISNWWGVLGRIAFDAKGNVLEKSLAIDDGRYHQDVTVGINVRESARLFDPCKYPGAATHPGYLAYRTKRTGALRIDVSPEAIPGLIHRAFDVRLDCLNSIRGCKTPGDIASAAWQDSVFRADEGQGLLISCGK